ncbi:hypothetical protein [Falsiroseomonas oryzae]|uniref:hypothetical protein n=1 Tax=Falsiroseomonas oryzae TaxID=2766473 RepID=UPI0022EB932A|nr:hypothetical protein [Roseomonas sp. MO-31]
MPSAPRAALVLYDDSFVADNGPASPRTGSSSGTHAYGNLSGQFTVDDASGLIVAMTGGGPVIGSVTAIAPPGTSLGAPPLSDNVFSLAAPIGLAAVRRWKAASPAA